MIRCLSLITLIKWLSNTEADPKNGVESGLTYPESLTFPALQRNLPVQYMIYMIFLLFLLVDVEVDVVVVVGVVGQHLFVHGPSLAHAQAQLGGAAGHLHGNTLCKQSHKQNG